MAKESEATKAVTRAARDVLRPLGLTQRGRSRTWLDDRGWWAGVVEFQSSSWSHGSYLNVGACWLWWPESKDHLSFDEGYREGPFVEFGPEEQFDEAAQGLVATAARQAVAIRSRFGSLQDAVRHLQSERTGRPTDPWASWNLAMALALAGEPDGARAIASQERPRAGDREWVVALRQEVAAITSMPDAELHAAVRSNIDRSRSLLQLAPRPDLD